MRSRTPLIAVLIAVELAIVGLVVYSLSGAHPAWASGGGGLQHIDYTAKSIAAISAGASPHVVVNDSDDRVIVTASTDGLVHVQDLEQYHGTFWGHPNETPLTVTRTPDGVSIARPDSGGMNISFFFSWDTERIAVAVPPGTMLDVEQSSGDEVTGLNANLTVKSQDGSIDATSIRADKVYLNSSDGHIELHDVVAGTLDVNSDDGHISLDNIRVTGDAATIHTNDGPVSGDVGFAAGGTYEVSSDDGHITLTLPSRSNLTVVASTNDGHFQRDGQSIGNRDDDGAGGTFTLGGGSGHLNVNSHDGSISIMTNGAN